MSHAAWFVIVLCGKVLSLWLGLCIVMVCMVLYILVLYCIDVWVWVMCCVVCVGQVV